MASAAYRLDEDAMTRLDKYSAEIQDFTAGTQASKYAWMSDYAHRST